jgi:NAD(P)-dependent dehydrogenase (short-subunit alcohol dehydrogenase family)
MAKRLADKIAVITGVGSGIGRATAQRFLAEGASVIGCDIASDRARELVRSVGGEGVPLHVVHPVDVTNPNEVRDFIERAVARYDRLDCLVNAAATARFARLGAISFDEDWKSTMRSEADSVFLMVNDAWPFLLARGGSIINFASTAALRAQNTDGGLAHSAAKGGGAGKEPGDGIRRRRTQDPLQHDFTGLCRDECDSPCHRLGTWPRARGAENSPQENRSARRYCLVLRLPRLG